MHVNGQRLESAYLLSNPTRRFNRRLVALFYPVSGHGPCRENNHLGAYLSAFRHWSGPPRFVCFTRSTWVAASGSSCCARFSALAWVGSTTRWRVSNRVCARPNRLARAARCKDGSFSCVLSCRYGGRSTYRVTPSNVQIAEARNYLRRGFTPGKLQSIVSVVTWGVSLVVIGAKL